ncbi:hypothetical protein [Pedobacter sp. CFBP9032]|uniref:hypothetical protein n=1 Tax=Pedobacter sp. CFBP9032 TaxID=3096539 RepID=UPI002A6A0762|nr:hypothetical protein [Pedobacter sp. CFBP9032]MDY0905778.1 hypothetical protein [Pedobacter sp. CFBP9032]
MQVALQLISVIAAIILITFGVNNISEPSNLKVWIGVAEIMLAILVLYLSIKNLFKKL